MIANPILVVEDDPVIAGVICRGLAELGHATCHVDNGADAVARCLQGGIGAMVLDRMLPDISGLDVLSRLRGSGALPPVLMLSALGSVQDRIEGLTAGADDYLTKPFATAELDARLSAIRRRGTRVADHLVVGRLRLDNAAHSAFLGEARIDLNRKQFSMLAYLMRHADTVVARAMLLEKVWGYAFDPATNIVESNMSRLRGRLLSLGCDGIETLRGEGYMLRAALCS